MGFRACTTDPCVFVSKQLRVIICLYVDDGLIFWKEKGSASEVIDLLRDKFEINISETECYAGLQISQGDDYIFIHQRNYLMRVMQRFDMEAVAPSNTPADPHVMLSSDISNDNCKHPFRELVGSLMFLAVVTRPDIAFAVSSVSRFLNCYSNAHWTAAKRILQYLKSTANAGLLYHGKECKVSAFSDADFAGDQETRRSRTGAVLMMNGGPVFWNSSRQSIVTLSSCESEFVAATTAATAVKWCIMLAQELGIILEKPTLFLDNQSAIKLIKNPEFHMRTKHIDVRYKYIRERHQEGLFDVEYVPSDKQLADAMTKPLARSAFRRLTSIMLFTT